MIVSNDIHKNRFACLVNGNNDFCEESKNHFNLIFILGILIQKEKEIGFQPSQPPVQLRKKGGRCLRPPSPDMVSYCLGKQITPSFADIDFTKKRALSGASGASLNIGFCVCAHEVLPITKCCSRMDWFQHLLKGIKYSSCI